MPLFKLGDKWDIAMAAVYIASDAGWSSFITLLHCILFAILVLVCYNFYQSLKTLVSALQL